MFALAALYAIAVEPSTITPALLNELPMIYHFTTVPGPLISWPVPPLTWQPISLISAELVASKDVFIAVIPLIILQDTREHFATFDDETSIFTPYVLIPLRFIIVQSVKLASPPPICTAADPGVVLPSVIIVQPTNLPMPSTSVNTPNDPPTLLIVQALKLPTPPYCIATPCVPVSLK